MSVRKSSVETKDGRAWIFETRYKNLMGDTKRYTSKKYKTKREALEAEHVFLASLSDSYNGGDLTFKELYENYYSFQKDKVKITTLKTYYDRKRYICEFDKIKLKDFNAKHYEQWKKIMYKYDISDGYRNSVLKFLKMLLNYATKWYGVNFSEVYPKLSSFKDPNAPVKEEMKFYTVEEFQQFIAQEDNLVFRCAFEIMYFCGLRRGETVGLPWKYVDFEKNEIAVRQNVVRNYETGDYMIVSPKTKSSIRNVPMVDVLVEDLKKLKEISKQSYGFNENWFVLGFEDPLKFSRLRDRKKYISKKAGVKEIRLHDFRHSCASLLISRGANITLVARFLGHTKIEETLNTYSHFFKSDLEDLVSRIDDIKIPEYIKK